MTIKPFTIAGNVGIGTTTVPAGVRLDVVGGNLRISTPTNGLVFPDNTIQRTAYSGITYGNTNVSSYLSGPVIVGNLFVSNSTVSTSSTTGSLITAGGVGISGNLNVDGINNTFTGNIGIGTTTVSSSVKLAVYDGDIKIGTTGRGLVFPDGTSQLSAASPLYNNVNVASYLTGPVIVGNLFVSNNTVSTSASSGALVVYGGLGVGGALNIGDSVYTAGNMNSAGSAIHHSIISNSTITGNTVTATVSVEGGSVSGTVFNARTSLIAPTITANTSIDGGSVSGTVFNARTSLVAGSITSNGEVSGTSASFSGNVTVGGNLIILGNVYSTQTNVLVVNDSMIYLGKGNPGNTYDLGIVGNYNDGTYYHTGIVKNHSTGDWTFFDSLTSEPSETINWSDSTITPGNVKAGNITIAGAVRSTSYSTGSLKVTGGVGISGNLNVDGTNSLFNNKVGIGTSSAVGASSNVLAVYGTASVYGNIQLVNNGGTSGVFFPDGTFQTTASRTDYGNANVAGYLSGPVVVGNLFVANTTVSTSTTTGAVVNAGGIGVAGNLNVGGSKSLFTGNVGIGTSSVTGANSNVLTVYGTATHYGNIQLINSAGLSGIFFPDGTLQTSAASSPGGGGTGAVQYKNASGTFGGDENNFYYDSTNHRVGIGSGVTANATLNVWGNLPSLFNTKNGNDPQIIVGNSTSVGIALGYNTGSTYGYLRSSPGAASDTINWNASGVGINGINRPINALDVSGGAVIGAGATYAGAATAPSNGLLVQGAVGIGTISVPANSKIYVNGGAGLFSGNVGIGTTTTAGIAAGNVLGAWGNVKINNNNNGQAGIYFADGTFQNSAATPAGNVPGGATGGGTDQIFTLNGQTITADYAIPTNYNAGTFGPVTINSGITITIPSGSVWSII